MSVILTACRHSRQRAIDRALKKRAEKALEKQNNSSNDLVGKGRLKKEAELLELEQEEEMCIQVTKAWAFQIDGRSFGVAFYFDADAGCVEVYNDDDCLEVISKSLDDGQITHDFVLGGSYKARITSSPMQNRELDHVLTVNGYPVPE